LFSDRFGPARALQLTLLGDAIFFGLSAAATTTWSLILIRFSAGLFSPLVPALSFIFQTLRPEEMVGGMGRYTISITTAYFLGAALIGIAYETIGWLGTSLVTCAIAALAALYAFVLPVPASVAAAAAAVRVPSSGVRDALRSPEFIAHGSTAFAMGWLMNLALSVAVIELQLNFKFSVAEVSYVFLSVPAIITAWALLLPTVSRAIGLRRSIGVGALLNMVSCALLASPLGSASAVSFITLFILAVVRAARPAWAENGPVGSQEGVVSARAVASFVVATRSRACGARACVAFAPNLPSVAAQVALCFQQNTNQALARGIGAKYTVNGTGAVVGASRTAWALGQVRAASRPASRPNVLPLRIAASSSANPAPCARPSLGAPPASPRPHRPSRLSSASRSTAGSGASRRGSRPRCSRPRSSCSAWRSSSRSGRPTPSRAA
jgi:MFS family permease